MMIGPMKKKMITVGVVSFILPTILLVAFFGMYSTNKKAEIEKLKQETAVVMRYVFSGDMPVDHVVTTKRICSTKKKIIFQLTQEKKNLIWLICQVIWLKVIILT